LALFERIVIEARSMVREREAMLRGDRDTIARKVLSAVFLVRSLNLADAAIDAAKCSHGEVLALLARSCWELAFIVGRMAKDEKFAAKYDAMCVKARANHLRKLLQYIEQHPDEDKEFSVDLKNTLHELEKAAAKAEHNAHESARAAGDERIYRRQYAFLCDDAHHSTLALELYVEHEPGGVTFRDQYPTDWCARYLRWTMEAWCGSIDSLLAWCEIQPSEGFTEAMSNALKWARAANPSE